MHHDFDSQELQWCFEPQLRVAMACICVIETGWKGKERLKQITFAVNPFSSL